MATITIVGAGMMGTALTWPATDRGHVVRLVGTPLDAEIVRSIVARRVHPGLEREVPPGVEPFAVADLATALDGADLVVNGVSTFGIDWFTKAVGPLLRPGIPVLSVTKGLVDDPDGTLVILPAAIDRDLPRDLRGRIPICAIGGPCTAHELAARRHTSVVFAGSDPGLLARLRDLLATPRYHVAVSTDVVGVEACAALKNAYALGIGIAVGEMEALGADGPALAYNPQAALFGQACREMRLLVEMLGGDPTAVAGPAGAGDLYVTVFGGRTVRLGKLLGHGVPFDEARAMLSGLTLEALRITTVAARALRRLEARGVVRCADFPLLFYLEGVVEGGAPPLDVPWERFVADVEQEADVAGPGA